MLAQDTARALADSLGKTAPPTGRTQADPCPVCNNFDAVRTGPFSYKWCPRCNPGLATQVPDQALLHTLPPGHELRTKPLAGAQLRNRHSTHWRDITPSWGIAENCYDQLGEGWTNNHDFRFAEPPAR